MFFQTIGAGMAERRVFRRRRTRKFSVQPEGLGEEGRRKIFGTTANRTPSE